MKRKQIPGNMDSSPQKMSRRKALATMAGAVGLAAWCRACIESHQERTERHSNLCFYIYPYYA